jgi:DNA-binding XRE family transcriptional regulator
MNDLRQLRRIAKLTQAELAKAAGITREEVCRIERGLRKPAPTTDRVLRDIIQSQNLSRHVYVTRYAGYEEEQEEAIRQMPEWAQDMLRRLSKPSDLSNDTKVAMATLEESEQQNPAGLDSIRVIVQSRYSQADWQVMNGLAALSIYRAFPRTIYLKLLSEDFAELGTLAHMYQDSGIRKRKRKI